MKIDESLFKFYFVLSIIVYCNIVFFTIHNLLLLFFIVTEFVTEKKQVFSA